MTQVAPLPVEPIFLKYSMLNRFADLIAFCVSRSNGVLSLMRIILTVALAFTLFVIDSDRTAFRHGVFGTFAQCAAAGQAEVDSLKTLPVRWRCVNEIDASRGGKED
jgi:hypothetical protein